MRGRGRPPRAHHGEAIDEVDGFTVGREGDERHGHPMLQPGQRCGAALLLEDPVGQAIPPLGIGAPRRLRSGAPGVEKQAHPVDAALILIGPRALIPVRAAIRIGCLGPLQRHRLQQEHESPPADRRALSRQVVAQGFGVPGREENGKRIQGHPQGPRQPDVLPISAQTPSRGDLNELLRRGRTFLGNLQAPHHTGRMQLSQGSQVPIAVVLFRAEGDMAEGSTAEEIQPPAPGGEAAMEFRHHGQNPFAIDRGSDRHDLHGLPSWISTTSLR